MHSYTAFLQHKSRVSMTKKPVYTTESDAVQGLLDLLVRRGFLDTNIAQTPQTLTELRDLLHDVGDPVYTNPRNGYSVHIRCTAK